MQSPFTEQQLKELDKPLDKRFVSNRKGASGRTLKYLEGHDAIDQANRLFGYGNWAYEPVSCEMTVIPDPLTGEAIGVAYKAKIRLVVRGRINPIIEVGSQPVATWNVNDHVMNKRRKDASEKSGEIDESPFTAYEISTARAIIMESHEQAEKGAVTDALKRALRTFGEQFGNGLYGDGRVLMIDGNALAEDALKADWAKAYKVAEQEIEIRWPKFLVWALQTQVSELNADHKITLYSKIEQQKAKVS